jgi:alpha-galactosidase
MSLWSLLASPLIAGNDLRNMSDETKSILMNADVISIDQDTAAKPVQLLTQQDKVEILDRPLHDGSVAVGIFNRGDTSANGTFAWDSLKLSGKKLKVMDLWKHETVTPSAGSFTATIPPHGVVLLKVSAAHTK